MGNVEKKKKKNRSGNKNVSQLKAGEMESWESNKRVLLHISVSFYLLQNLLENFCICPISLIRFYIHTPFWGLYHKYNAIRNLN